MIGTKLSGTLCLHNDELDKYAQHEQGWREVFPELIEILDKHGIQHKY